MEIIVHGKPNAGCSRMTSGLDGSLGERIVNDFFTSMGQIRDAEFLVVEARLWKNTWYSVYTFQWYKGVKDTADRQSFFAVSVILPEQYFMSISSVYEHLRKVCTKYVIGTYLSEKGKYIVENFGDDENFNSLVSRLNNDFTNLQEFFDPGFKANSELANKVFYNIEDCDSKAFIQALRTDGRVIVSKSVPTKDALLGGVNQMRQELEQAKSDIQEKNKRMEELSREIKRLTQMRSSEESKINGKLGDLQNKLQLAEQENINLKTDAQKLKQSNDLYRRKLTEIASLTKSSEKDRLVDMEQNPKRKRTSYVPTMFLINSALIILFGVILCIKMPSDTGSDVAPKEKKDQFEQEAIQDTYVNDAITNTDEDCDLSVLKGEQPVNYAEIKQGDKLTLFIGNEKPGYKIYTSNLKNGENLKQSEEFEVKAMDTSKAIEISYRSEDPASLNENNRIVFYVK